MLKEEHYKEMTLAHLIRVRDAAVIHGMPAVATAYTELVRERENPSEDADD